MPSRIALTRPGLPDAGPDRLAAHADIVRPSADPPDSVDLGAVLAALGEGRLHSAGMDVFDREPLGAAVAHVRAEGRLFALPHIGSATLATRVAVVDLAVQNVEAVLGGGAALTPLPGFATRAAQVAR